MADFQYAQARGGVAAGDVAKDAGLRKFMLGVYNKLMLGILLAGVLAYVAGTVEPVTQLVFGTPLYLVVQWGPVVLLMGSMFFMKNPSPLATGILYWAIVTMLGLGLGIWVMMAEGAISGGATRGGIQFVNTTYTTIAKAFLITASAFGALSLWGYTTKRNLGGIGNFAVMALWGVVALSLLNFILPPSSTFEWIIMAAVFGLSAILIAVETQQLKEGYYALAGDARSLAVMTNWGALNFFISFVNMFRIVLMFLSSRD
ncbi:MAG TPA: Bax inhibitor-1/YccA family protein [Hyphomonadaceae bacterium]|nr:Bax inhibitor-1/YccA family protein [Hyphomonadaceae bacterium]